MATLKQAANAEGPTVSPTRSTLVLPMSFIRDPAAMRSPLASRTISSWYPSRLSFAKDRRELADMADYTSQGRAAASSYGMPICGPVPGNDLSSNPWFMAVRASLLLYQDTLANNLDCRPEAAPPTSVPITFRCDGRLAAPVEAERCLVRSHPRSALAFQGTTHPRQPIKLN